MKAPAERLAAEVTLTKQVSRHLSSEDIDFAGYGIRLI